MSELRVSITFSIDSAILTASNSQNKKNNRKMIEDMHELEEENNMKMKIVTLTK